MSWTLDAEQDFGKRLRIRRYVLDNGLCAILLPDDAVPILSYQTWFRVGSRHERPGQTGMAHFFEHLMFNETETMAPGVLDRLIEETGGDNNAATWTDWTQYRTSVPARDLELAMRIESERMERLVLEDAQIESEREVVMNERLERVEDDVDGFLDEKLNALAFSVHPYRWPTIGWMDDIRGLAKPDVQQFYRTYYAPNNAIIVLCGAFDEQAALDMMARYYGHLPAADLPAASADAEPAQSAERRQRFAKPVHADRLAIGYKVPGQEHPDWAVLDFIGSILCGGPSARLYRRLVVETEMASSVDCGMLPFRDPCLFRLGVNMARGHRAEEALAEIDAIVGALAQTPVSEAELTKVKNAAETDFWSSLEDCDGRAEALGHYETTLGDFRMLFEMVDRVAQVSADDIMRVARTYLTPAGRTLVIAEPESAETESEPESAEA